MTVVKIKKKQKAQKSLKDFENYENCLEATKTDIDSIKELIKNNNLILKIQ